MSLIPLVKPDVRISRIRLSRQIHLKRLSGSCVQS